MSENSTNIRQQGAPQNSLEDNAQDGQHGSLRLEPSAYLQRLIGRELVSNRYIALAELVKNAYDAGATEVTVTLFREKDAPPKLVVQDNGSGMSFEEFRRVWMMPGYSEKGTPEDGLENAATQPLPARSSRPAGGKSEVRALLGEKGIGRFAADKLAHRLTVITRTLREPDALRVTFNWDDFSDRRKKMSDIDIPFERVANHPFSRYGTGTRLELETLRESWELQDWRKLRRELQNLVTPFRQPKRFKIVANYVGENSKSPSKHWESGEVRSLLETQDGYQYRFELTRGGVLRSTIKFPENVVKEARKQDKKLPPSEHRTTGPTEFGPIRGAFYYVEKLRALKGEELEPGVSLYRDGFRVEPYGRETDDWLEVKATKARRQGKAPLFWPGQTSRQQRFLPIPNGWLHPVPL
jgi:anti-sigma regulatory factor (Ser/Thr protein kinase)